MAKPIIAVAIDMFSPAAYRASAWPSNEGPQPSFVEDYAHERGFIYLVLQPLLFRGAVDAASPVDVVRSAAEYFTAGRRLTASDVSFADESLLQRMPAGVTPVPVALPPDCSLRLDLHRKGVHVWTTGERIIGSDSGTEEALSPFVLTLDQWPEIAAVNFSHPLATKFNELDGAQKEQVYVWLGAAVVDLLREDKLGSDAVLTGAQREALRAFGAEDPLPTPELMRAYLIERDRASQMYELLIADAEPIASEGVHLSAPRFKIVDRNAFTARIQSDIQAGLPAGVSRASYLKVWWDAMCKQALREPADSWPDLGKGSDLAMALARYFGFGERLRWPVPSFDVTDPRNKYFMLPRLPQDGRFETNAASLCELVIRVPVSELQGDPADLSIQLTVAGQSLDDSSQALPSRRLASLLREMSDVAEQWATSRTCHAQARHDSHDESGAPISDMNGLVLVQTRSAQCIPIAHDSFAVPSVFYDLVDTSPRLSRNDDGDGLRLATMPRRALFPEECLAFDEATNNRATAWGIQGDFHVAAVSAVRHASGKPRVYEFVASRLSDSPVAGAADAATGSESLRFKSIIADVLSTNGRYTASLWLPNWPDEIDLSHKLEDADGSESDLRFYVLDDDPSSGIGAALEATGADSSKAIGAEIVIYVKKGHADAAAAKRYLPLNRLQGNSTGTPPWMALERAALSRVGQSVDRWVERFHVEPQQSEPSAPASDPVKGHLANFNKLRVYGRRSANRFFPITYPDAAVPLEPAAPGTYGGSLPWKFGWPSQPPFSYFVGHLYSQENATQRPDIAGADVSQDRQPEMLRYERYADPRAEDWITGYLEHQYSYRLPVLGTPMTVDARIATDVRNLAGLAARAAGTAAGLDLSQAEQEGLSSPLLELSMAANGRDLQIACRRDYLRVALGTQRQAVQSQGSAANLNVDTLRSIYEAVHDFMASLADGRAHLVAHLYRFDNQLPRQHFDSAAAQAIPARLYRFMTGRLPLRADAGAGQVLAKGLQSLAAPSFEEFKNEIQRLISTPGDELFPPVQLNPQDAGWEWRQNTRPLPAPDLQLDVNIVRVALDLSRSPDRVVDEDCALGRYLPLTPEERSLEPKWIHDNAGQVLANAKAELTTLLRRPGADDDASSLFFRRDWLHAKPPEGAVQIEPAPGSTGGPSSEPREKRWRLIFGDYAPTVLAPPGRMHDVDRVCEMFYVPHAFMPLREHPALVSADETTQFAEFLLQIAGEMLEGKPISAFPIKASAAGAAPDAVRARLRLEQLSKADHGIGHRLQELVRAVHNAEDLRLSTAPLVVRALGCIDDGAARTRDALRALLSASPHTYVTSRAIGVILFDPSQDRFSRSLQSVQLCKRISQNMQASQVDGLVDVDRFVVPPTRAGEAALILDPLESARYDSEFELLQNGYTMLPSQSGTYDVPIDLGDTVKLKSRGGVSGRTGEDLIESINHFPLPGDDAATARAIEIDAPHWNPHWAYEVAGSSPRQLYLLPSRRFPNAPVTLQVSAAEAPARKVSLSGTAINIADLDGTDRQSVFEAALKASLKEIDGTNLVIRGDGDAGLPQDATVWRIQDTPSSTWLSTHAQSEGWHRIDTFLEHHYFLVESGESVGSDDAFANDVFEIDVQVNRAVISGAAAPPASASTALKTSATSRLLEAFRAAQRATSGAVSGAPIPVPDPMTLPELAESTAFWLCNVQVDTSLVSDDERTARLDACLLWEAPRPPKSDDAVHFRGTYAIAQPRATLALDGPLQDVPEMSERVGSIVMATTFLPVKEPFTARGQRRILRITVLADPWSRLQVRVKQVRNQRNVDGGKPDMDAVFSMASPYSSWSGYAHAEYVVNEQAFADSNVPLSERQLAVTQVSLEEWLDETAGPGSKDIGNLLAARLSAKVPGTGAYNGMPYWTHMQMMAATRMVSVVLRQIQPDRHILHDGHESWKGLSSRDFVVPRHVFGIINANQVDAQLKKIAPDTVTAGEPELEVTWLDLASQGPVYRVNWPIRFLNLRQE